MKTWKKNEMKQEQHTVPIIWFPVLYISSH